ncbi:hypothetical protein [Streptomyces lydicus]|uniref:hypothetical protein n=1 Tax=Streptomyces lydicus TaxID=47763 RepID=UPI00381796BC
MTDHRERYTIDFWTRMTELSKLEDGWLDGHGIAPTLQVLELAGRICTALPHEVGMVYAYPTEEGGALLEWADDQTQHQVEVRPDMKLTLRTVSTHDREVNDSIDQITEPLLTTEWAIHRECPDWSEPRVTLYGTDLERAFCEMELPLRKGEQRTLRFRDVRYTPWGVEQTRKSRRSAS